MDVQQISKIDSIMYLMKSGKSKSARIELEKIKCEEEYKEFKAIIDNLLSLCQRHSVKVILYSIPRILIGFCIAAAIIVFLRLLLIKWLGPNWSELVSQITSVLSFALAAVIYYTIEEARDKYPTIQKPVIPWIISIVFSFLLISTLVIIFDFFIVAFWVVLNLKISDLLNIFQLLEEYWNTSSFIAIPIVSVFSHPLLSLFLLATSLYAFYGPLSEETAEFVKSMNEVIENV